MKQLLNHIHPVPEAILEDYLAVWQEFKVPAKTIITREGQREHYMYYVVEGIQKSYYETENKQHIIAFTYPPSFSGIPEAFFSQKASSYNLASITSSSFLRISYADHQSMMQKHRPIETLFRKATEHLLIGILERYHALMAHDIETRVRHFMQRSPHLLNMVSRKDLASYLRIDPTNLSKLLNSKS